MSEMLKTVRSFNDFMKANPTTRKQFKTNKLTARREYNNEINESEINAYNLDQVQQLINEDKDIVFDTLVAADYIDEVDCTEGIQPSASLTCRKVQPRRLLYNSSREARHLQH